MLQRATLGLLTQGTIFCCAKAEDYPGCQVFGLVITARCDVANDKTPIYTYLPIVSLKDWLDRDGGTMIASRATSEALGTIRQELRNAGHSLGILETEPLPNIINVLFPVVAGNKAAMAARERMVKAADTDDVVLSSIGQLNTPIWRRRRATEGFDGVYFFSE